MYITESQFMITIFLSGVTITGLIGYLMFIGYRLNSLTKKIANIAR